MKKLFGLIAVFFLLTSTAQAEDLGKTNGFLDIQIEVYGNNVFMIVNDSVFAYTQEGYAKVYSIPKFSWKRDSGGKLYSKEFSTRTTKTVVDKKYHEVVAYDPNPFGGWKFFAGLLKYDGGNNSWIFIPYNVRADDFNYDCRIAFVNQLGTITEWSRSEETDEYSFSLSGNAIVYFDPITNVFTGCILLDTCGCE